jgi:predicted dehydrogenase
VTSPRVIPAARDPQGAAVNELLVGAGEQGWESRGPSIAALGVATARLAAIADRDARQLAWTAERLRVRATYASMTQALADTAIDAVVLAVPNHLHEPLTLEALEAGCHVLCEKPMALDAAGGRRMIEAAARARRVLAVGYAYPYMHPSPSVLNLGSVHRIEGRWTRRDGIPASPAFWDLAGSGAGPDLLGHLLSVVRMGMRRRPVRVTAQAWSDFGRVAHGDAFAGHDTLEALIAFEGGATAHLVVAWAAHQAAAETIGVTFHGAERSVEVPLMGRETDTGHFRATVHERGRTARRGEAPRPVEACFAEQARNWLAAASGEETLRFTAEDPHAVQCVLDAASASALEGGRPVDVEDIEREMA